MDNNHNQWRLRAQSDLSLSCVDRWVNIVVLLVVEEKRKKNIISSVQKFRSDLTHW